MASGRSADVHNLEGTRRTVNGKILAPRSRRKNELVTSMEMRYNPLNKKTELTPVQSYISKVYLD